MSKRNGGIKFNKPEEPAFIRKMKEKIGYREGPDIETKRESLAKDDDQEENDDEKPTVVVLRSGDLNEEEANQIQKDLDDAPGAKKIVFKKPEKNLDKKPSLSVSSTRLTEESSSKRKSDVIDLSAKRNRPDKVLLSFNDEEEGD
ncbi:Uncharacterized protein HDE_13140 [Halotydeus destructor]|nr:Uncharacterized protein HDE_13140 [Halotydeus destructor]